MTNPKDEGDLPRAPSDAGTTNWSWMRGTPGLVLIGALSFLVVIAGFVTVAAVRYRIQQNQLPRLSGIPASVSSSLADLMALSPVASTPAPEFSLVDQYGHSLTLSSLRGRAVVMEFMDTHCTDICPIVSQEFVDANHDLGVNASRVVFVAVNVNQYHARVADVATFSQDHQLNTIASWHFVTGSTNSLRAVWKSYGIDVVARGPNADVVHSSEIFFIDPQGRERFIANPVVDHTSTGTAYLPGGQIASWGHGIALTVRSLAV